LDCVL